MHTKSVFTIHIMYVDYIVQRLFSTKTSSLFFREQRNIHEYTNEFSKISTVPPSEHACFECSLHLRCRSDFYTSNDDQHSVRLRYIGL